MKAFVILSTLVSMAMARPGLVQTGLVPTLQSRVSASASASSSSAQQLPLLRALSNVNGQGLDSIQLNQQRLLGLSPLVSASSSAIASSLSPNVVTAGGQVIESQLQQQRLIGVNPLLPTTHLAQSLASFSPAGASSSSSVQVLESPQLRASRLQQNVLLAQPSGIQSNGLPLLVGSNGQYVASPLLVL